MKSTKTCARPYWTLWFVLPQGYTTAYEPSDASICRSYKNWLFSWVSQQWFAAWFHTEAQSGLRLQYPWLGLQMLYRHVPPHLAFRYLNNVSFWSPTNDILILHKTKESDVLKIWQFSTLHCDFCVQSPTYIAHVCMFYMHVGFYICNLCTCIYVIIVWILRYFYTYKQALLLCLMNDLIL